ncbi:MAG: Mur ligase family protein, partial [Enterococcus italicus]
MFTVKEVAQLFGIEVEDSRIVTSVEFDSRKVVAGSLFVPLAGARDGHTFINQAIASGAIATFWSVQDQPEDITVIQVTDCLEAMQKLATYYRELLAPKVVAITGSNGKTTTKDLTASVLSQAFRTYKTQGN